MLSCEAVRWAKPCDVIGIIPEGMDFVCGHVELLHARATV